jgi:hypothetical protein
MLSGNGVYDFLSIRYGAPLQLLRCAPFRAPGSRAIAIARQLLHVNSAFCYLQTLITAEAQVGMDLNAMAADTWRQALLNFVPGLYISATMGVIKSSTVYCGAGSSNSALCISLTCDVRCTPLCLSSLQTLITAVAQVGVDLNAMAANTWRQAPLQFVPGLGPRKARALLAAIAANDNHVKTRVDLLRPNVSAR